MVLAIFAIFASAVIVIMILIALGRVSFSTSMIIFGVLLLISLTLLSAFVPIKTLLKTGGFFLGIAFAILAITYCIVSGGNSLLWWAGKDTIMAEKEKRKACPKCGAQNMLGRFFCSKCGKQLINPTDIKNLKVSKKITVDENPERLRRKIKNFF